MGLGFDGPYAGGRHQFLVYQASRLAIPTKAEDSVPELRDIGLDNPREALATRDCAQRRSNGESTPISRDGSQQQSDSPARL